MSHLVRPSSQLLLTRVNTPLLHNYPQFKGQRWRHAFWENDRKGGYIRRNGEEIPKPSHNPIVVWRQTKEFLAEIPNEVAKLKRAIKEPNVTTVGQGDYKYFVKFRDLPDLSEWPVTVDATHGEGRSTAEFVKNEKTGTAIFQGEIRTDLVKTGDTVRAGYASIRSHLNDIFKIERAFNFCPFTHLVIRYRGDGRHYLLCLNMKKYLDFQWLDQYNFYLFTRGGPYWQTAKIPFSKFFLSHRGRIQDQQTSIELNKVRKLNISAGGAKRAGPFHLELDYIALYFDGHHKEEFAYEMYETSLTSQGYN